MWIALDHGLRSRVETGDNVPGAAASKQVNPVRCASFISGLLILVFATSAFECVTGCDTAPSPVCVRPTVRGVCVRETTSGTVAAGSRCGEVLKSSPRHCSLHGLAQVQVAEFRRFETASPLQYTGGRISLPFNSATIISSIGSPQTDRGPPRF
jgi:hypothetical protein